eukprot:jgi/Tetstr1/465303/TSEL_010001.t1
MRSATAGSPVLGAPTWRRPTSQGTPADVAGGPESSHQPDRVECTSLAAAVRQPRSVGSLRLEASPELVCHNMLCEKVGDPCVCRLARALERLPSLTALSLAGNGLDQLPDALWGAAGLRHLDLSHNRLPRLPGGVGGLAALESLDLRGNPLRQRLPAEEVGPVQMSTLLSIRKVSNNIQSVKHSWRCRNCGFLTLSAAAAELLPCAAEEWRRTGRQLRFVK